MDMDYKNSSRRFRPLGSRRFKSHDLNLSNVSPSPYGLSYVKNEFWINFGKKLHAVSKSTRAETGTDEVGQNYIIRIGPKRRERKGTWSQSSLLSRARSSSFYKLRDSRLSLSFRRAPSTRVPFRACCSNVTSCDFPNWLAGYQSVISYSTTLTSDQTIWMSWCSVELWNF